MLTGGIVRRDGSWSMTEGHGFSLQFALYVRDALGIADGSPGAVPPLAPAVPPARHAAAIEDDARAWRTWFARLLAEESTGAPKDPLGRLLATGPTPGLGAAAAELSDAAQAWYARRQAAHAAGLRRQPHGGRVTVPSLVAEVEHTLGRRAAPFTLHLVVLPVAGLWEHRARRDLLLFSDGSRNDPARLRAVLVPVVREFA